MKIVKIIKTGNLKGWTIRKSKGGWYDLYSCGGISQTRCKHTLTEINDIIKSKQLIDAKKISNIPSVDVMGEFDYKIK